MCVSNLHIHIFTNVLKFGRYDPNLFSLGQARFCCFPRVFFYQQLETNLSVSCLEVLNAFVIQFFISSLFYFFIWVTDWVKTEDIFRYCFIFTEGEK